MLWSPCTPGTVIWDQNAESATCSSKVFTCVICGIQIVEGVDYAAEYVSALLNCIPCCGADFHALCRMIPYWYTWETKLRTKMSLKEKRMFKVWMPHYKFSNYRHFFSVHMKFYFSYALSYAAILQVLWLQFSEWQELASTAFHLPFPITWSLSSSSWLTSL
jgi:hypothetical protein